MRGDVAELETGMHVKLTPREIEGDDGDDPGRLAGDDLAARGRTRLPRRRRDPAAGRRAATGDGVDCEVEVGGTLSSHKGMNIPGATGPASTDGDLGWVEFAVEQGLDLLAVSFVSKAADLDPVTDRLRELGSDIPRDRQDREARRRPRTSPRSSAPRAAGSWSPAATSGSSCRSAEVPVVQKRLIREAGMRSKPAITATQMLASMVHEQRPTRAEVTDVANAIYDGTDAVMLSEETAVGKNPVEAVRVMDRIARATEPDLRYGEWLFTRTDQATQDVADSVAQSAVGAVYRLGLAALVVPTNSGRTARLVAAHRPNVPVLAISASIETVRRLSLLFGVTAIQAEHDTEVRRLLDDCAALAAEHGMAKSGDLIAITAGLSVQGLGTNLFEVHRVP